MDSTLPQMRSFGFDRLDPIALEDTLAYLRQHPEPPTEDIALFGGYQEMFDDAVAEGDWVAGPLQDDGQSSNAGPFIKSPFPGELVESSESFTRSPPLQGNLSKELLVPHSFESSPSTYRHIPGLGGCSAPHEYMPDDGMVGEGSAPLQHFDRAAKLRTSSGRSKCTWDGCEQISQGDEELRAHLDDHSNDCLAHWTPGSKCTWQGCKSKAAFKALSLFKHHLLNIHTNPLLCTQPRCSYKKPFKNKHELERHNSTQHSVERRWECPYDSCPSESRTFARKDKWLQHIRETQHENDAFCPFYHCSHKAAQSSKSFESRKEIGKHFSNYHAGRAVDGYGCGLGSCENSGRRDRWDLFGFQKHLSGQHNISFGWFDLETYFKATDHIFRLWHIPSWNLNKWVDCKICTSQTGYQTPLDATTSSFPSSATASF